MEIKSNSIRLIINTSAQYLRTIINLILSLYSTRLILHVLGIEDYGIFTLIAGVVSMLAFMTNAMISTTQRFLSFHQTKSNIETQQIIFGNSILMHIIFGIVVLIFLELVGLFLFDGFLKIPPLRITSAKIIYQCAILMIIFSFITAPYKALLISHENMVYISIIEIVDGIVKVVIAYILSILPYDKLIIYGLLMILIYLLNLLAYSIYDYKNYPECISPRLRNFNRSYLKAMSAFVGWQLYSTGCVIARTQGTAIILNRFFGTIINAAFGIAQQVSGAINFVSSSLVTSINPQIVKAEGSGDRKKMFDLAEAASKFSFLLLAMVVVPVSFVMPELLKLWLGEIPAGSVLLCRVILITALLDQITYGLISANQAIGNIGPYALTINTIKILTLPCLWILLKIGVKLETAIWSYAIIELICSLCRIPFLKYSGNLNVTMYIKNVFLKLPIPLVFIIVSYLLLINFHVSFLVYVIISIPITLLYCYLVYKLSLNLKEKNIVTYIINNLRRKINL